MALRSCYATCAPCDGTGCRACTGGVTFARAAVTLARSSCCELIRHVAFGEGVHPVSERAA